MVAQCWQSMQGTEACQSCLHKQSVCSMKAWVALVTFSLNIWAYFSVRWRAYLHEVLANIKEAIVTKMQTPDRINKCILNTCYLPKTAQDKLPGLPHPPDSNTERWLCHVPASLLKPDLQINHQETLGCSCTGKDLPCMSCSETRGETCLGELVKRGITHLGCY